MARYRRILLKLSGEAVAGAAGQGFSAQRAATLASEIAQVAAAGVQLGIVIGGGNLIRGVSARGIRRVTADTMGMLATVMNALALADVLEAAGAPACVLSAIEMPRIAEPHSAARALRRLQQGRIVVFAGGTSNPYVSTDTAAALRALEIEAELLAKGTRVAGVFDKDPEQHPDAVLFREISFQEVLARGLGVLDAACVAMCRDHGLPIAVFNLNEPGNIMRISMGEAVGTLIHA
ncbi:MAG: UMP kinase [Bryobacterales bacterium]|nr:UMP kinase [Bryobacteraceae bacterium]MDW8354123.1 UMP kinase [Bryobacterales bacterium]